MYPENLSTKVHNDHIAISVTHAENNTEDLYRKHVILNCNIIIDILQPEALVMVISGICVGHLQFNT